MTQTLRRELRNKFEGILNQYYQDNPPTEEARIFNKEQAELLADAALEIAGIAKKELPPQHPNIYKIYESNIGVLTPMIAERLNDIEKDYSPEWFSDAVMESVKNNKRNLAYIEAILKRWVAEGRDNKRIEKESEYETI